MASDSRPPKERSTPLAVPSSHRSSSLGSAGSPLGSPSRRASTARLGSPVPTGTPPVRQIPTPRQLESQSSSGEASPLPGLGPSRGVGSHGPGESALAAALQNSYQGSPPRFGTPPVRPLSPTSASYNGPGQPRSNYGSFDPRVGSPMQHDNLEIVKRHLAGPSGDGSNMASGFGTPGQIDNDDLESVAPGIDEDEFSSLRLQGGDVTRPIYRLVEQQQAEQRELANRRKSFHFEPSPPEDPQLDFKTIKQPGGFRRNYIRRAAGSPSPNREQGESSQSGAQTRQQPQILTTSFIEFLSLYGHFAGEELDEEYEEDYFSSDPYGDISGEGETMDQEYGERSALLPETPGKKKRRKDKQGNSSPKGAALLLLKSFVGTGVLFLPKAFLNGGMVFSSAILLFVAALSYYCFLLLCSTRLAVPASFGGMGKKLYGKWMLILINFSLVISQIGFSAAYIVFVSENLQAFVLAVSKCKTYIDIKWMILLQMIIFLPLSLYRNLHNIQKVAIIADVFILLGLLYLYYFDIFTLVAQHGIADIEPFNPKSWTLFIGTAIFTFEGIGLVIPIQESMKEPKRFPGVLGLVMIIITIVFTSMGALSYAAFGSKTKTVVILNMPQDSKFVNGVQFIYSLAILLSTPLQFFPAIEITSKAIFTKTGKNNPYIKWKKNIFRFLMVIFCALVAWVGADDLDKFVALIGTFACIPLVYIYPPMLHYKAISRTWYSRFADVALIIFGFIVMVYTTSLTIQSWVSGGEAKSPGYCDAKKHMRPAL
ncbi:amino acid transporter-like protein [Venturia nashicola]|nr:amino acid transporter-like protein [Venturia nashicola]